MSNASQEESRDSSSPDGDPLRTFLPLSEGDFHARLAAHSGIAVVLFSAPHCGACRTWKRLLPAALSDVVDTFFEVDVSEATGVARYFDIFHLPTIYIYRDGRFHAQLECPACREAVRETALRLLGAAAQDEP